MLWLENKNKQKKTAFTPGEIVTVRSLLEISRTLSDKKMRDGCLFMEQMWDYCDQSFPVMKVVYNLFDERRCRMHASILPLYILDGVICNGIIGSFKHLCDHSCYLLWHPDWIRMASSDFKKE